MREAIPLVLAFMCSFAWLICMRVEDWKTEHGLGSCSWLALPRGCSLIGFDDACDLCDLGACTA